MTNLYYNASGNPPTQSRAASGVVRSEYSGVESGFDKLPTPIEIFSNTAILATDIGAVNAFIPAGNSTVTALSDQIEVKFRAANNATGPATLNYNLTGALPLQNPDGSALSGTTIVAGQIVTAAYSLSRNAWQLMSGNTVGASGTTAWASPGAIGSTTPNSGAFTTLRSSGLFNVGDTTLVAGQTMIGGMISTDTGAGQVLILRKSNAGANSPNLTFAKSRGTAAVPLIVAASDSTMSLAGVAYDGATYGASTTISASIDGAPGAGSLPGKITFSTSATGSSSPVTRLSIDARGQSVFTGGIAVGIISTSAATYTVLDTDSSIIFGAACTVTMPTASLYPGRKLYFKVVAATAVISSASNVVPLAGGAAGTAILAATAGRWSKLQSDGANWQQMSAG